MRDLIGRVEKHSHGNTRVGYIVKDYNLEISMLCLTKEDVASLSVGM